MDNDGATTNKLHGCRFEKRNGEGRRSGNHRVATTTDKQQEKQKLKHKTRGDAFKLTYDKRLTQQQSNKVDDDDENVLKIIYGNVRGFTTNKFGRLKEETMLTEANLKKSDIIVASESGYVSGAQRHLKGYKQVGNQPVQMGDGKRKNTHNGGVCVWIRKDSKGTTG